MNESFIVSLVKNYYNDTQLYNTHMVYYGLHVRYFIDASQVSDNNKMLSQNVKNE